jgi:mono/diheme cytochrome c family protein
MHPLVRFLPGGLLLATALAAPPTPEQTEFFETKVRPLLAGQCLDCHSVAAGKQKGGLLLDSKAGWETGGDSGPAIVPGQAAKSLLISAVKRSGERVEAMPPKKALSAEEIALLEQWIDMGAPDPRPKVEATGALVKTFDIAKRKAGHWCWQPVSRPVPPTVRQADWPRQPIDSFILHRLESAGLRPAPPADPRTLTRRLYLDVTGLPPTPADFARHGVDGPGFDAAKVVDELLASPRFGEKWARHWMDLVRYAETCGHEFDYEIPNAWRYRDYLIRALNLDLPYDVFVREHIAGDLLAEPRRHPVDQTNESVLATGFWYFHEAVHAPTDVRLDEAERMNNQIDVFGKTFQGLTIACARCHDHKFDAISTADYYALTGYLRGTCRTDSVVDPGRQREIAARAQLALRAQAPPVLSRKASPGNAFLAAHDLVRARIETGEAPVQPDAGVIAKTAAERGMEADQLAAWCRLLAAEPSEPRTPAGFWSTWVRKPEILPGLASEARNARQSLARFRQETELFADFSGSALPTGWTTTGQAWQPSGPQPGAAFSSGHPVSSPGMVSSALLGEAHVGTLRSPTFPTPTPQIHLRMRSDQVLARVVTANYHMAVFSRLLFGGTIRSKDETATGDTFRWISLEGDLRKYVGQNSYLEFIDNGNGHAIIDEIRFSKGPRPPVEFPVVLDRLLADGGAAPAGASDLARRLDALWEEGVEGRGDAAVLDWLLGQELVPGTEAKDFRAVVAQGVALAAKLPAPQFALAMAQGTPENGFVSIRGSHLNRGAEVPNRYLEALGGERGTRLDLAGQIVSTGNPLAARVMVNRLWHHLFDRGLVRTVDDFGVLGETPSHPELLDWLARDFMEHGWSVKRSLRQMLLSATYAQASTAHPELDPKVLARVDPTNVLLHRAPVRRLTAEEIRDAILAVSGRLDPTAFGPAVPTYRSAFMTGRGARPSGPLDGAGRRTVYLSVYRNFLNPMLLAFDMPNPFGPKGRRGTSNVPAQALTLLNDPFVLEQAAYWASHETSAPSLAPGERLAVMLERATGDRPEARELTRLQAFWEAQTAACQGDAQRAWTDVAHLLFNTKDFLYIR